MITKRFAIRLSKFISRVIYFSGMYGILNLLFRTKGIYIVFYHRLGDKKEDFFEYDFTVDQMSFEKQAKYFKGNYEVISMDTAVKMLNEGAKLTKKYMVLTFDDGYRDNFIYGYKAFKKYDLKPTIYLTANNIDKQAYLWTDAISRMIFLNNKEKVEINILKESRTFRIKTIRQKKFLEDYLINCLKGWEEEEKLQFIKKLKVCFDKEIISEIKSEMNKDTNKDMYTNIDKNKEKDIDKDIDIYKDKDTDTDKFIDKDIVNNALEECNLMLNWNQVKALMDIGVVIGAHTMTHPILSKVLKENIPYEIIQSKALIEMKISKPVLHFAYPNGKRCDYSDFVKDEVAKHYKSAVTTISGVNNTFSDICELKRIGLSYDMNVVDLKVKILYIQIKQTFNRWKLILRGLRQEIPFVCKVNKV